jgi:hypothetical protein
MPPSERVPPSERGAAERGAAEQEGAAERGAAGERVPPGVISAVTVTVGADYRRDLGDAHLPLPPEGFS